MSISLVVSRYIYLHWLFHNESLASFCSIGLFENLSFLGLRGIYSGWDVCLMVTYWFVSSTSWTRLTFLKWTLMLVSRCLIDTEVYLRWRRNDFVLRSGLLYLDLLHLLECPFKTSWSCPHQVGSSLVKWCKVCPVLGLDS